MWTVHTSFIKFSQCRLSSSDYCNIMKGQRCALFVCKCNVVCIHIWEMNIIWAKIKPDATMAVWKILLITFDYDPPVHVYDHAGGINGVLSNTFCMLL